MRKGLPFLVAAACLAVQLASCGGSGGGPAGGAAHTLSGTLVYDKVPSTSAGLNYAGTVEKPIRGVEVRVVDAETANTVLGSGVSGNDGRYSVSWTGAAAVKIVFLARTSSPIVAVQDNTAGKAVYGLASGAIDATTTSTANLKAAIGWTGTSYSNRSAAPFAVLDAAWEAVLAFQAVRPSVSFPELHINWSVKNAPVAPQASETQEQAYAAGRITTSHWNRTELYILGQADVDTDEFDDHIIVHEWGHYFETKLGRSDSPGGQHVQGELKDARLAFGEGWGNALSAMIWSPNTVYSDASGARQASGFGFDLENNVASDPAPGWFSEGSAQSILFDLFDSGANEPFDTVALGLGPIYDAMTVAQKNTPAMTTLFSFISAVKAANPGQAGAIDTLTRYRNVVGVPVADAYGTGETVSGGSTANLPVYRNNIVVGTGVPVTLLGGAQNAVGQNRYFRFPGNGAPHTVSISTPTGEDVDAAVYQNGVLKAFAQGPTGTETTGSFATASGTEYIIVVTGFGVTASYTTTVTVN
jgi:hypothetical protein